MANDKVYTDYLMHGRTKGSRNGVSTTKGYTAVGQRAKGRYINGRYVYDLGAQGSYRPGAVNSRNDRYAQQPPVPDYDNLLGKSFPATEMGKRQSWQQIGDKYRAANIAAQKAGTGESNSVNIAGMGRHQQEEANKRYQIAEQHRINKQVSKVPRNDTSNYGSRNNWQQQGNTFRAANETWERFGSGKSKGITGTDQKGNYGGYGQLASLEGSTRAMNALSGLGKLRKEKKNLSLYGSGDTKTRNSRSDIANAFADAKADAKNAFKTMKQKALLSIFNKSSIGVRKDKKKKKSFKDFFK